MELAFDEAKRLEELNDLGVSPILARRGPLHTHNTSPFQHFLRKIPKVPEQLLEQRFVPLEFLKRSDVIVPKVNLFVDVLPRRSPRARDRAPQCNVASTCPDVVHRELHTGQGGHVHVTGQPDTCALWIIDVDRVTQFTV